MTSTDRLNLYARPQDMRMAKGVDGGMGHEDSFFGPVKLITMGFMGFLLLGSIGVMIIQGVGYGLVCLAATLLLSFFLVRFVILEENKYKKIFDESHFDETQSVDIFDNVLRISGDNRDSQSFVYMGTGETCLVVQIQHGSIVGKGEDFDEVYYDTLSEAFRMLIMAGYTVIRRQLMINCREDPRLLEQNKKRIAINNPAVEEVIKDKLGYIMNISEEVQYENEYWFIYTRKVSAEDLFLADVSRAISELRTVANLTHICTKGELYALDRAEFGCPSASLGERRIALGSSLKDIGKTGIYLNGVVMSEYSLQEARMQEYYGGDVSVFSKILKMPEALSVDNMLGIIDAKLGTTDITSLKDDLYAKFIVNSDIYKQSLVQSLGEMSWDDDEDEDN